MAVMRNEPIALIGSGCRFPGNSISPAKLWQLLQQPRDVLSQIPPERFNPNGFYNPDGMHHGSTNVRDAYVLSEDHRLFDSDFFNINPLEASAMDPQQRLLLEVVYESLESAGQPIEKLRRSNTAVYVGLMAEEYSNHLLRNLDAAPVYMATGTARSMIANRVSYFFDWCGPSMTIDTACSSSLIAVHQAVQALRGGDSDMAVAAGSNLLLNPEPFIVGSKLKMLSPTGRSRMWDSAADGYARADGVAAVILKTLSKALEDGDHIDCIIRESGINHDGQTRGLTVPSSIAQEKLIRDTYTRAGLDLANQQDHCQYFEAHGTGTIKGDPREAQAINNAFFTHNDNSAKHDNKERIVVGSVKTVIGHSEGTAGLAGILKASLAIQHGIIPPNMLFKRLNPDITPFYSNLEILSQSKPWTSLAPGQPRRASVNSFGFGGSNAHVILESFELATTRSEVNPSIGRNFAPFTFSAASERSLFAMIAAYTSCLRGDASIDLRCLAYTLNSRRSILPFRLAFSSSHVQSLVSKMDATLSRTKDKATVPVVIRSATRLPLVLGVFTGQGAQWASMGRDLIIGSEYVRRIVEGLDCTLAQLPASDRPSWSIVKELTANAGDSRLSEAAISQPLCTAIQIVLINLINTAGLRFEAIVGQSSGEIAAAYAAGFISSQDAIKIAYYRGLHTRLAGSGAMLAVGTSIANAEAICNLPDFKGRICVAANNSPSSVTLSGDLDAIHEAKAIFDDEKTFSRVLAIDKAYHSHHMLPCVGPYAESLRACAVATRVPSDPAALWFSSVYHGNVVNINHPLNDTYWKDNMVHRVMYAEAVESAIAAKDSFDMILEVGPHPTLKGPTLQTVEKITGHDVPYLGLLNRGQNDVESFADALGLIWTHYGEKAVDLEAFNRAMSGIETPRLATGLPSYPWDHERIFWLESRAAKAFRTRKEPVHELLGTSCGDRSEDFRWKNLLRLTELPWLDGHRLQGEVVFPAAAYVVTALEGAKYLAGYQDIYLIELQDLIIGRPMTFDDVEYGVETLFTLNKLSNKGDDNRIVTADFKYYSATKASDAMTLNATGRLKVWIGEPVRGVLPPKEVAAINMIDVNTGLFYSSLSAVGYGYTGPFRALSAMKRKLDRGSGMVRNTPSTNPGSLLIHPAMLDAAFQSAFLAFCWPEDGSLQELQVPTRIHKIRVNPFWCKAELQEATSLPFDSVITERPFRAIEADVNVYNKAGAETIFQIEGIRMVPFSDDTPSSDRRLFSEVVWDVALPDAELVARDDRASPRDYALAKAADQVSLYYLLRLKEDITHDELARSKWYHKKFFAWADQTNAQVVNGQHKFLEQGWINTTLDEVQVIMAKFPESLELKLVSAVGENFPAAIRGRTNTLQHMMKDNLLNNFYEHALGLKETNYFLGRVVGQIAHRYPQMNVLEIGAGTGAATRTVLQNLGRSYLTYTFTDISTGFFEAAQELFKDCSSKMIYNALDIDKDISGQGFEENSYDLVIGSMVFHATRNLEFTMRNVRRLLKPGGFLVMLEFLREGPINMTFLMGGLPGWWFGDQDGRSMSPAIDPLEWDALLQKTGFSGADSITPMTDVLPRPFFVIASQAFDDRIGVLRRPLLSSRLKTKDKVVLLGGVASEVQLADRIAELLRPKVKHIVKVNGIEDLTLDTLRSADALISLIDLYGSVFKSISSGKFSILKHVFGQIELILWVTRGCREIDPYSNITVGLGRTLAIEMPQKRLQFLDLDPSEEPDAALITETFVRLLNTSTWLEKSPRKPLLWSIEPELVQADGRLWIPRVRPKTAANDRYNSLRRTITRDVDLRDSIVNISFAGTSLLLEDSGPVAQFNKSIYGRAIIKVSHSLLSPIRIDPQTMLFILCGIDTHTGAEVFALSDKQASMVDVPYEWTFRAGISSLELQSLIVPVVVGLVSQYLISLCAEGSTIMAHDASPVLVQALAHWAKERKVLIVFSTSQATKEPQWVHFHPFSSGRSVESAIPQNLSLFVDLSTDVADGSLGKEISRHLPQDCVCVEQSKIWGRAATTVQNNQSGIGHSLIQACTWSIKRPQRSENSLFITLVTPKGVNSIDATLRRSAILDWTRTAIVPVMIEPVDSRMKFAHDRTYILFGLTTDLGQSICHWMVCQGARCVVLTSRAPNIQESWIRDLQNMGATVKVFANDITDRKALQMLCSKIFVTMPPVAGIVNGAMVLQDTLFSDMDLETLEKVMRPKVYGSSHLEEIFWDVNLDFFIFLSSVSALYGNRGQSNYSAASLFMTSLVYRRRKRGLAASVLYMGPIIGAGYVTRTATQGVRNSLQATGYQWVSERDVHQGIAEAILVGRPEAGQSPEIAIGVRECKVEEGLKMQWFENPKFQHMINQEVSTDANNIVNKTALSVRGRLLEARARDELYEIIRTSFLSKLQTVLQLHTDADRLEAILDQGADELGIDSLVAVEIRTWFLKEIEIDLPLMKVLGGAPMRDLLEFAVEKLPGEFVPGVDSSS